MTTLAQNSGLLNLNAVLKKKKDQPCLLSYCSGKAKVLWMLIN